MINKDYLNKKENREDLLQQIVFNADMAMPVDERTWFDKEVDLDLFRKTFFDPEGEQQMNQPYVRFNNTKLMNNQDLQRSMRSVSVMNFKNMEHVDITSFCKMRHFSSQFVLEMRGYHVIARENEMDTKVVELDGLLTYHIADPETGRKIFIGHSIAHIAERSDAGKFMLFRINRVFWELLSDSIKMKKGIDLIVGEIFTNLRNTAYKGIDAKVGIHTYNMHTPIGKQAYYKSLAEDINAINKHLVEVVEMTNWKTKMFGCN